MAIPFNYLGPAFTAVDASAIAAAVGAAVAAAALGTGIGPYPVDEDGGLGAGGVAATIDLDGGTSFVAWADDALRYTSNGTDGVGALPVRAYEKTAYDARTGNGFAGQTTTRADGRWAAPLLLASGDYYVIADAGGDGYVGSKVTIRVP